MRKDRPTIDMPPAEKKRLSYLKDCRPSYGNNVKAARKAVPRRKAIENRNDRRVAKQDLTGLVECEENMADVIESSLIQDVYRVGGWTKGADIPLGKVVKSQKAARINRVGAKALRRIKHAASQAILAKIKNVDTDLQEIFKSRKTKPRAKLAAFRSVMAQIKNEIKS